MLTPAALDDPPAAATDTIALPGEAIRFAGTLAVICAAVPDALSFAVPALDFHTTVRQCACGQSMNPLLLRVIVKSPSPAVAFAGERFDIAGAGGVIGNGTLLLVPPREVTVRVAVI